MAISKDMEKNSQSNCGRWKLRIYLWAFYQSSILFIENLSWYRRILESFSPWFFKLNFMIFKIWERTSSAPNFLYLLGLMSGWQVVATFMKPYVP